MSTQEERMKEQQRQAYHQGNLQGQPDTNAPETLKYVSKPEDIESPIAALEWINSKSTSTANLSEEDVRSKEWVLEYHQLMARMERPPEYGIHGHFRAYIYDDAEEFKRPLKPKEALEIEGYTEIGKESSTRSKGGWGVETSTRDTKESIVRDQEQNSGGGGIFGVLRD
jgi:hypothetical protein